MKSIKLSKVVLLACIFLNRSAFAMEQESLEIHMNLCGDNNENRCSEMIIPERGHNYSYLEGALELRFPQTEEEWKSYHAIRFAEIHERYCEGHVYDYKNHEEELETNFRFILIDSSGAMPKVVGALRVDLLSEVGEASLRWVAIDSAKQKQGFGTRMLVFAEEFVKEQKRNIIRVPAEEYSWKFYERLGYIKTQWPAGPNHPGEVSLAKRLK